MILVLCVQVCGVFASVPPTPNPSESVESYISRYGEWVDSIPDQDKAWDAMKTIQGVLLDRLEGEQLVAIPGDDGFEESAEFVAINQDLVESILKYNQKQYLGMPVSELWANEPMLDSLTSNDILLAHLSSIYFQSKVLMIQVLFYSDVGRVDDVLELLESIRSLQGFVQILNTVIEQRVEFALDSMVDQAILAGDIDISAWTELQLVRLRGMYVKTDRSVHDEMATELWMTKAMVDWMYEESREGRITIQGANRYFALQELFSQNTDQLDRKEQHARARKFRAKCGLHKEQLDALGQFYGAHQLDFQAIPWELSSSHAQPVIREITESEQSLAPTYALLPILSSFYQAHLHWWTLHCVTNCFVELQIYQAQHGEYPESLDVFDKELKDKWVDQMSGNIFGYRLIDGIPIIYSSGPDRDDDGGRSLVDFEGEIIEWPEFLTLDELKETNNSDPESLDGDWILYPLVSE